MGRPKSLKSGTLVVVRRRAARRARTVAAGAAAARAMVLTAERVHAEIDRLVARIPLLVFGRAEIAVGADLEHVALMHRRRVLAVVRRDVAFAMLEEDRHRVIVVDLGLHDRAANTDR